MSTSQERLRRRGVRLEWCTLAWSILVAILATGSGIVADSIALLGFGLDGVVEAVAAGALLWRLRRTGAGGRGPAERRALYVLSATFLILAGCVVYGSVDALEAHREPGGSAVGLAVAVLSLFVMPTLAYFKQRTGGQMGSEALGFEAIETWVCSYLSVVLLAGVGLNSALGWWWADPIGAIAMLPVILWQGFKVLGRARERGEQETPARSTASAGGGGPRRGSALLSRRDWVYLLSLLVPFVLYDLFLKGYIIILWPSSPGFWGGLVLMQSDLLFSLGYVLLWVGLFALARRGVPRWVVVILFHLTTIIIVVIITSAYQYFRVTGSTLGADIILFYVLSKPGGTGGVIASEVTTSLLILILVTLAYAVFGPWVISRLVGRWRGWPTAEARTTRVAWLHLVGVALAAYALISFSLIPGETPVGVSKSFSTEAFVNVVEAFSEVAAGGQPLGVAVGPVEQPPNTSFVPTPGTEKRNVVLIHLESTRAQSTTPYGGDPPYDTDVQTTPFLNELAKSSLLAEDAHVVVPHTANALTAVNCGVAPPLDPQGTIKQGDGLPARCLGNLLKDQGYNTVWFTSSVQSFESERLPELIKNFGYDEFYPVETMNKDGFQEANYFGYEDDIMLKPSEDWLEKQKQSGKPFLATYETITPHHNYLAPTRYGREDFDKDDEYNRYLNAVRYQDFFLKNLFDQYKALGLYDNTVFILYGDHGEGFGEHGRYQHDNTIYEEGLKMPLIVHDPRWCENGCTSGGRIKEPTSELDVLPTVAGLLGYGIEGGNQEGYSLLRPIPADRTLMFSCWSEKGCMASLKGNEKYIYQFGNQPEEVFDLSKDPGEQQNLAGEYTTQELDERRSELLDWRAKVDSTYGIQPPK